MKQDKSPTYLGFIFDPRLTRWHQVVKAQTKGMQRTALLKKLADTQWGANADILRKTYTGYVRPTLEYGIWNGGMGLQQHQATSTLLQKYKIKPQINNG